MKPTPKQVAEWMSQSGILNTYQDGVERYANFAELAAAWGAEQSQDGKRMDALATPGWELSMNQDYECFEDEIWVVHHCTGGRNDREWALIGKGATPRAAIDVAMKGEQHDTTR